LVRRHIVVLIFAFMFSILIQGAKADDRALCFSYQAVPYDAINACDRLVKAVRQKNELANLLWWRGSQNSRDRRHQDALSDFDEAIRLNPKMAAAYRARGLVWVERKDDERALADFAQAIKIDPKDDRAFAERGKVQNLRNNMKSAIADYDAAIRINPKISAYWTARGLARRSDKDFAGSISDFSEAIRLEPRSALNWFYRGESKDAQNSVPARDEAIADLSRAIQLDSTEPDFFSSRGSAFIKRGEFAKAIIDYDVAYRLDPKSNEIRLRRGSALIRLERFDEALEMANQILKQDPANGSAFNIRGAAWQGKKMLDAALDDYGNSLKFSDHEAAITPLMNRANTFREKGDLTRAFEDYKRAQLLEPASANVYGNRGLAWRAAGDLGKALEDFNEAIRVDPNYADAYTFRGLAFEAQGNNQAAKADFQTALGKPGYFLFAERYKSVARARLEVLRAVSGSPGRGDNEPLPATEGQSSRRIALVIGNGKYLHAGTLANPINDARLISRNLRDIGFEVTDGLDLDKPSMKQKITDFLAIAAKSRTALVFYAGHGMQVDGKNYLVPIDFDINQVKDAAAEMVDVDFILSGLDDQIRTNIIILDACRDNPLVNDSDKVAAAGRSISVRSGLAAPSGLGAGATLGAGTLLAFATAPGQVALDGDGTNSPFSSALGRHISTPGVEVQQMLTRVRAEVVSATKNRQVPWSNSSLLGEVFLVGPR
jgi:tetratricopeptide (TPR) repeat protein